MSLFGQTNMETIFVVYNHCVIKKLNNSKFFYNSFI